MRIPLDEQLPHQLAPHLVGHDVRTVQQESWVGLKNRALLTRAEDAGFSVFVTGDQNLEFQQNIYRDGPSQACFARLRPLTGDTGPQFAK